MQNFSIDICISKIRLNIPVLLRYFISCNTDGLIYTLIPIGLQSDAIVVFQAALIVDFNWPGNQNRLVFPDEATNRNRYNHHPSSRSEFEKAILYIRDIALSEMARGVNEIFVKSTIIEKHPIPDI